MTEAVEKFIPIFVGLLLILRGLFWIVDGKNGNKRSNKPMPFYGKVCTDTGGDGKGIKMAAEKYGGARGRRTGDEYILYRRFPMCRKKQCGGDSL